MQCPKCDFNDNPNLEETGPHTKAICPECGAYIKMVGKDELNKIVNATNHGLEEPVSDVTNTSDGITLIIKTTADEDYMPLILNRVATALKKGYVCGEGVVAKPFDPEPNILDTGYNNYEFYYKK